MIRIGSNLDSLDHIFEKEYREECSILFTDMFMAQKIVNRLDPNEVKEC